MVKNTKYDSDKYYIITVKFVKKGDKVDEFVEAIKERKDWTPPWWVREKIDQEKSR